MPKRLFIYPIITFVGILILCSSIVQLFNEINKQSREQALSFASSAIAQALQQQIVVGIASTSMLEATLRLADFDTSDFESWGAEILSTNPSVSTVQLAPKGVVRQIYPMSGHEKAVGHDLLADPRRLRAAMDAIQEQRLTMVGPLRLIQNNRMAIIARKPVMQKVGGQEVFWGFSIALIYIEDLVGKAMHRLDPVKWSYRLEGDNPDTPELKLIAKSETNVGPNAKEFPVHVPNGVWKLTVDMVDDTVVFMNQYLLYLMVFIVACFATAFVFYLEKKSYRQSLALRQLNAELQEARDELSRDNILKDKFFSILAHDMRNPFQSMMLVTELINQHADKMSKEEIITKVGRIHLIGERMVELLENLLEWAGGQLGTQDLQIEQLDLNEMIQGNVELVRPLVERKGVMLKTDQQTSVAYGNPHAVQTALRNLMNNAIKFTPEKGQIEVKTRPYDGGVAIIVGDNGVGMTPDQMKNIFALDEKTSTAGTSGEKGTGLGLPLSCELLEKSGAKMVVESEAGKGSIFRIILPQGPKAEY
ncbi:ATP-binding protein [Terasakiella sp. SH-1]|uniref:sensor histidine kinase n=1 Tax=Terasakiella sp. SH-1 TaxID=2560057 RepID=UPI001073318E|nr:ATP-binding protein [Terasakiella sp. SH-1]